MANNLNDIMNAYQQFMGSPMQFLSRRFNIPQNINFNDPNAILQHLLNSGQVSQGQINQVMSMKNSPIVQALMNKR